MNGVTNRGLLALGYRRSRGLTLVEILIALLVLSIGLLGLAGLQTLSLRYNASAYQRTQATALAYGLADRMRANREAALAGDYNAAYEDPAPACVVALNPVGPVPDQDLAIWRNTLACRLPQSTGSVAPIGGTRFTVSIQWDDSQGRADPLEFEFTTAL